MHYEPTGVSINGNNSGVHYNIKECPTHHEPHQTSVINCHQQLTTHNMKFILSKSKSSVMYEFRDPENMDEIG